MTKVRFTKPGCYYSDASPIKVGDVKEYDVVPALFAGRYVVLDESESEKPKRQAKAKPETQAGDTE